MSIPRLPRALKKLLKRDPFQEFQIAEAVVVRPVERSDYSREFNSIGREDDDAVVILGMPISMEPISFEKADRLVQGSRVPFVLGRKSPTSLDVPVSVPHAVIEVSGELN